jgi:hypothetical protein
MKNYPEEDLQIAIMDLARMYSGWNHDLATLIHIPNGGFRVAREAGRLKMAGVKSGVSDLHMPPKHERPGLWIELKHGKNTPTKDQEAWLKLMFDRGQRVAVVRSLEGAAAVLAWHLDYAQLMRSLVGIRWERGQIIASNDTVPRKIFHSNLCDNAVEIACRDFEDFERWLIRN